LRTVNVVRRDEIVAEMKALGGDVVLVDGPDLARRAAAETGNAPITLALDGVGDTSPMNLMNWKKLRQAKAEGRSPRVFFRVIIAYTTKGQS